MKKKHRNFREFYSCYLSEHGNPTCRMPHFIGSWLVLGTLAAALIGRNPSWLVALPTAGYGYAWAGHFFFERNRPATFTYPRFSFAGDWVMFWHLLTGKIPFQRRA